MLHDLPFRPDGTEPTAEQMMMRARVLAQIEDYPSTFCMGDWERPDALHPCDSARCLAGWAQFLARGYVDPETADRDAVEAMGLSRREYYPGAGRTSLFFASNEEALRRMRMLAAAWS